VTHCLYTGVSQSGKTTLARHVSRILGNSGSPIVVYDPMGTETVGGGWHKNSRIIESPEEFLDLVHDDSFVNTNVFIDEAHHIFSHEQKENLWMLTQGRHYGLTFHLMTQRPKKVHPDARTNCGRCYMFRLAIQDATEIGADYGHSGIARIPLDRGDFLMLDSGSATYSRGNVFQLVKPQRG